MCVCVYTTYWYYFSAIYFLTLDESFFLGTPKLMTVFWPAFRSPSVDRLIDRAQDDNGICPRPHGHHLPSQFSVGICPQKAVVLPTLSSDVVVIVAVTAANNSHRRHFIGPFSDFWQFPASTSASSECCLRWQFPGWWSGQLWKSGWRRRRQVLGQWKHMEQLSCDWRSSQWKVWFQNSPRRRNCSGYIFYIFAIVFIVCVRRLRTATTFGYVQWCQQIILR